MLSIYGNHLTVAIREGLSKTGTRTSNRSLSILALVIGAAVPSFATANTYVVNTTGDPGPVVGSLSLRQAITAANASVGNDIEFAPGLIGSTITLASGQIAIQKPMTITGPGADELTISGNNASRVFYIRPVPDDTDPNHTPVSINGLTLTQGNAGSGYGGAIFAVHSKPSLTHMTIAGCKAAYGGGLNSYHAKPLIDSSRFTGNHASGKGGAVYSNNDASLNIVYSTIDGNSAAEQGGGIFVRGTVSVLIGSSTISGNMVPQPDIDTGPQGGGGIAFSAITINGSAEIVESTITQNYAATGGAGLALMDAQSGNATELYFSTIVGNSAGVYETGIGITSAGGTADLYNTIAANNFSQTGTDDLAGSFKSRQSLIKSPGAATITGSGSVIGVDPQLGPLADNGGPTLTMLPATTSPAIHGVTCSNCVEFAVKDQRGAQRHNPSDIGAVERQYPEDLIFRSGFSPP